MKKIAILITMLLCLATTRAQHDTLPYYVGIPQFYMEHSIYDETYDIFAEHRWGFGEMRGRTLSGNFFTQGYEDDIAIRFTSDTTLHIIGIAVPLTSDFYYNYDWENQENINTGILLADLYRILNNTNEYHDSIWFKLYQPDGNHMTLIKSVVMDTSFDTANARFYMPIYEAPVEPTATHFATIGCFNWWGLHVMLEVYFDSEVDLTDSFYISCEMKFKYTSPPTHNWGNIIPVMCGTSEAGINSTTIYDSIPVIGIRWKNKMETDDDPWNYDEMQRYPLLFPIIRRDCDTCPQAQGLQYVRSSADKAFFRWQRGTNHHDWQLSYGPAGTAPEDGTILNCANTSSSLVTLDPDSHYVAYVRARCKFARYEYGPWSAPLAFSLNGGNGIDGVDTPDITLTPNPATERVTVSATGMQSVELLAVDGTVILHHDGLHQDKYPLDLKGLAAGVYMVRVSTPLGTATRRLLVQ